VLNGISPRVRSDLAALGMGASGARRAKVGPCSDLAALAWGAGGAKGLDGVSHVG
jgi:hypothetical protein